MQGLRDTAWVTSISPYVVVQVDNSARRTRMIEHGGSNPVFNQELVFPRILNLQQHEMWLTVWDRVMVILFPEKSWALWGPPPNESVRALGRVGYSLQNY